MTQIVSPAARLLSRNRLAALSAAVLAPSLLALAASPAAAQIQEERPQEDVVGRVDQPLEDQADDAGTAWSVSAGSNFTTAYYFRGIIQDPDGLLNGGIIAQPYIELGVPIIVPEDGGWGLNATVGQWNSFGSEQNSPDGPSDWYESDLYAGLSLSTGDLEFFAIYTFYTSPNDSFATVQEIGGGVAYNLGFGAADEDADAVWTLGLGAGLFFETDNSALGPDEGTYLELSAEPGFEVDVDGIEGPVAVAIPVTVGLSVEDYYYADDGDDEMFGYVSVGATATLPLPVPSRYGAWTITPGIEYLYLGSDSLTTEDGDDSELIGFVSVDFEF